MGTLSAPRELLYLKIARSIESQISHESLRVGDKLPSIRMICRQHGVSMSTAQYAYYELERKSLIESRPQSGYYVSGSFRKKLELPESSRPANRAPERRTENIFENNQQLVGDKNMLLFSHGVPAPELLPVARLNKQLMKATRELPYGGIRYESMMG